MKSKVVKWLLQILGGGIIFALLAAFLFIYYLLVSAAVQYEGRAVFKLIFGIAIIVSLFLTIGGTIEALKHSHGLGATLLSSASFTITLTMFGIAIGPIYVAFGWLLYFFKASLEAIFNVDLYGIPHILGIILIVVIALKFEQAAIKCKDWYVRTYFEPINKVSKALEDYEVDFQRVQEPSTIAPRTASRERLRVAFFYLIALVMSLVVSLDPPRWMTTDRIPEDPPLGYRKP